MKLVELWDWLDKQDTDFAAEQEREDAAQKRRNWKRHQNNIDPEQVVFVDATRAKTNTTWTHDRSQRRTRVIEGVSFGRRETITFVEALRVTAPLTVDGPSNGCIFLA